MHRIWQTRRLFMEKCKRVLSWFDVYEKILCYKHVEKNRWIVQYIHIYNMYRVS